MNTQARTFRILLSAVAVIACLFAVRAVAPKGSVEWLDYLVLSAYIAVLLGHKAGIPGLLEHNGLCGWGMCSPTPLGWTVGAILWLLSLALVSWIAAWAWSRFGSRRDNPLQVIAADASFEGRPRP